MTDTEKITKFICTWFLEHSPTQDKYLEIFGSDMRYQHNMQIYNKLFITNFILNQCNLPEKIDPQNPNYSFMPLLYRSYHDDDGTKNIDSFHKTHYQLMLHLYGYPTIDQIDNYDEYLEILNKKVITQTLEHLANFPDENN